MVKTIDPCEYVGVTGIQCQRLNQIIEGSQPPKKRKKNKKRAPSFYNLYIKACFAEKGGVKKFSQAGPLMTKCAKEYRADKKKGDYRYEV